MGDSAMGDKAGGRAASVGHNVKVSGLGGQDHGDRGKRSFAIAAGTAEDGAGEKVGDRFHGWP